MSNFHRPHFRGKFRGRPFYSKKPRIEKSVHSDAKKDLPPDDCGSCISQADSIGINSVNSGIVNQKAALLVSHDKNCPYPGWLMYFPTITYDKLCKQAIYTKAMIEFIKDISIKSGYDLEVLENSDLEMSNSLNHLNWNKIESRGAVLVDFSSLYHSKIVADKINLQLYFDENADGGVNCAEQCANILNALGLALHTLCYYGINNIKSSSNFFKSRDTASNSSKLPDYIAGRIINYPSNTPLKKLRAHHLGRFISVKGVVVRLGPVDPVCQRLMFECCRCEAKHVLVLPPNGHYSIPKRCLTKDCRSKSFEPLLNHPETLTVDTQIITVQEASEQDNDSTQGDSTSSTSVGRSSRQLVCRLDRDLIDSCIPGDLVHITGIVGLINTDGMNNSSGHGSFYSGHRGAVMYSLILNVNSLICLTGSGYADTHAKCPYFVLSYNENFDNLNPKQDANKTISSLDSDFSIKDLYGIREISEQPDLFRLLVASLCPSICGRGLVKAGLLLALFGGTQTTNRKRQHAKPKLEKNTTQILHEQQKNREQKLEPGGTTDILNHNLLLSPSIMSFSPTSSTDFVDELEDDQSDSLFGDKISNNSLQNNKNIDLADSVCSDKIDSESDMLSSGMTDEQNYSRRSSSHILIVGDPGLGKSQLLRASARLAPRVLYVCGNTATAAGLTVSTIRESNSGGGGFGLEAGALVLADQGCCCIDEFDKLTCDPAILLEAMEQQTVSIARGGLVASLPARAAVLAAANPTGGHYDITRRLDENLKIAPALLSRFDLIFVLLDRPDEAADRLLSEHVTSLHTGNWKPSSFVLSQNDYSQCFKPFSSIDKPIDKPNLIDPNLPLAQRLELGVGEKIDFIPPALLRKYIMYARKYVMPCLSVDASVTLRDYYLDLRKNRHSRDSFPVTLRQLESLVRLTQARARAELREEATRQDALDVCELMCATGLGTGHIGGTPANATLSQLSNLIPSSSRRLTSSTGPAAAKRLLSALEITSKSSNSKLFTLSEINQIAESVQISSNCVSTLLDRLNEAGAILKSGKNLFKVL